MTGPTRICRTHDYMWAGSVEPTCWYCDNPGDDQYSMAIALGPDLSSGWNVPYDEDTGHFMWTGY